MEEGCGEVIRPSSQVPAALFCMWPRGVASAGVKHTEAEGELMEESISAAVRTSSPLLG